MTSSPARLAAISAAAAAMARRLPMAVVIRLASRLAASTATVAGAKASPVRSAELCSVVWRYRLNTKISP